MNGRVKLPVNRMGWIILIRMLRELENKEKPIKEFILTWDLRKSKKDKKERTTEILTKIRMVKTKQKISKMKELVLHKVIHIIGF